MSKTEILRQSAAVSNERRVERLANQIEMLRQADRQSVEELAETLEPLAQAMAALTDETRQTLAEIDRKSREQVETFNQQIENSATAWNNAAAEVKQAANSLNKAGERMEWTHYALTVLTGAVTAILVTAFWLCLAPPRIMNQIQLDPQAVAEHLKPVLTGRRSLPKANKRLGHGAVRDRYS